jgi:hypothetical protein
MDIYGTFMVHLWYIYGIFMVYPNVSQLKRALKIFEKSCY